MSATPSQHSTVKRINRAYVQVPPSPFTISGRRTFQNSPHVASSCNELKENTPLKSLQTPMSYIGSSSTSLKRKLSDREHYFDDVVIPPKQSKLTSASNDTSSKPKQSKISEPANNTLVNFSDGLVYCHQCNKKRDPGDTILCSASFEYTTNSGNLKQRVCRYKYCKPCLKNRYNEDLETHKSRVAILGFKCPRCRDICNCPKCRKAKDLMPIRVIGNPKPKNNSVKANLELKTKEKHKGKEPELTQVQQPAKQRNLPVLKWRRVPVDPTRDEADNRIFIREFLFRFEDYLDPGIAKSHMEELEVIGGRTRQSYDDDDEIPGWVNEQCLKAIVLGLLGILAKDRGDTISKLIKSALKNLRAGGANLNKIWSILASLRDDISKAASNTVIVSSQLLTFPDPVPPPASAALGRSLRSVRVSNSTVNVVQTSQMIPVIVSLVQSAIETKIIRDELYQGLKDNKDIVREAKEATQIENERWEKEKQTMDSGTKDKAQKAENFAKLLAHKDRIADIENAVKIVEASFAARFVTLGSDNDGRVYYVLSPGVAEREAAFEYLQIASSDKMVKLKKRGRVLAPEDRKEMREWSWFVAVWGTRPHTSQSQSMPRKDQRMNVDGAENSETGEDDEDELVPKWWGFCDVEDIKNLAEWISIKSGIEDKDDNLRPHASPLTSTSSVSSNKPKQPRIEQLKKLVGNLREYAELLQWRTREDKYVPPTRQSSEPELVR